MTPDRRAAALACFLLLPQVVSTMGCAKSGRQALQRRADGIVIDADAESMLRARGMEFRGFVIEVDGKEAYDLRPAAADAASLRIKLDPKDPAAAILVGLVSRQGPKGDAILRYSFENGRASISPVNEPQAFYDRFFEGTEDFRHDGIAKAFDAAASAALNSHGTEKAIYQAKKSLDEIQRAVDAAPPVPPLPEAAPPAAEAAPAAAAAPPAH